MRLSKKVLRKLKKLNLSYRVAITLFVLTAILGVGFGVKAYGESFVNQFTGPVTLNQTFNGSSDQLGSVIASPSGFTDLRVDNDFDINSLQTEVSAGNLVGKASTTILSIQNPFGATSTIDFMALYNTAAATTTYTINCATSTTAYAPTSLTGSIISSGSIGTSTNFQFIENGITTALGATVTGGTVAKIIVQPTGYLICQIAETYSSNYWTTTTNAFAGTYKVRWLK